MMIKLILYYLKDKLLKFQNPLFKRIFYYFQLSLKNMLKSLKVNWIKNEKMKSKTA